MNVGVRYLGKITVVIIDNSILQDSVPILQTRLEDLIKSGRKWIIIDLLNAEYLSSVGLAVIAEMKRLADSEKGDLVLCNVNHLIVNLLEMTNMNKLIRNFDTIQDAEEELNKLIDE